MFDINICEAKRVSLVRFHGELSARDWAELDRLARTPAYDGGFHSIYDFTEVKVNALITDFVAKRGERPQIFKGYERYYVVPADVQVLRRLVRMFIDFQKAQGEHPPILVDTLAEALERLGAGQPDFKRVASGP